MKIELKEISVRDVVSGYTDNNEEGIVGYNGNLDIRPPYQREFVYKDSQRDEVIVTVSKNFPLNVMYWIKNSENKFEILDGQQRTISLCQYVNGDFSINHKYFHSLTEEEKEQILDYKLMIYICEGTDREKLDWFKIINIAGEKLTEQELRNAVYTGPWLNDAKKYFSKNGCVAYLKAHNYLSGQVIRQDYLETCLKWISNRDGIEIEDYMTQHQYDSSCNDLWMYFQNVINWIEVIFPTYRKEMKGLNWGILYNKFSNNSYNSNYLENEVQRLMKDEDVTKKSGIYEYLLSGEEKYLNIRKFTDNMKREAYERQKGICPRCGNHFEIKEMEGDHTTPWHLGGKTTSDNCQMLCVECNRRKGGK